MTSETLNVKVHDMRKLDGESAIKAFCDLSFADLFVVRGFKVVENEKGMFVGMPSQQGRDEKWYPTFTPATPEVKQLITSIVMDAYED
jgi:stage V sporulation protein G